MAENLVESLRAKVEAAAAAQRQVAAADLHELLMPARYTNPQPGDEERLADALRVLKIKLDDLDKYVEFVHLWEAHRAGALSLDQRRADWKKAADEARAWSEERGRIMAELSAKDQAIEGEHQRQLHVRNIAIKADGDAASAARAWARFASGGSLFER